MYFITFHFIHSNIFLYIVLIVKLERKNICRQVYKQIYKEEKKKGNSPIDDDTMIFNIESYYFIY